MATQPYIPGDRFEDVFPNRPGLLTAKDVARMLAVSEKTVYSWVNKGAIPYCKLGSCVRFSSAALKDWVRHRTFIPKELQQRSRKN